MSHKAMRINLAMLAAAILSPAAFSEEMDKMWGDPQTQPGVESSTRAALFRDGNYGMFIHWGIYSHLGGQWKDQTFYGIGEWIKRQMKITVSLIDGDRAKASLSDIRIRPVE